jgi:hypothetical protein
MENILYIHGYGSTGNAMKARKLQAMLPEARVVAPTFDYDHESPFDVLQQLKEIVAAKQPAFILGSSTGGYYALCCTSFYGGPVWCVNPVRDIFNTLTRIVPEQLREGPEAQGLLREYERFDREVFRRLQPDDGQLHFALSTDDELLGDHRPLLELFPNHGAVVWKDRCGHRFFRFDELKGELKESL